jgi:hypothetical protein
MSGLPNCLTLEIGAAKSSGNIGNEDQCDLVRRNDGLPRGVTCRG